MTTIGQILLLIRHNKNTFAMSLSANHLRDLLVVFLPAIHDVVNANYFTLFYFF
jgi:hypothetical protein